MGADGETVGAGMSAAGAMQWRDRGSSRRIPVAGDSRQAYGLCQMLESASPGVCLRGFPRTRPDLVEAFQHLGVQVHQQRPEVCLQFLDRSRSDDRGGDDRVAQQPGERNVRRRRAQLPAEPFVGFELVAVRASMRCCIDSSEMGPSVAFHPGRRGAGCRG